MRTVVRRGRWTGGAAVVIASLAVTMLSLPAASADPVEYTQLEVEADYGHPQISAERLSYGSADPFIVFGTTASVSVNVDSPAEYSSRSLTVAAADGDVLEAGRTYTGATDPTENGPGEPGLSFDGNGVGCDLSGEFTVNEIAVDDEGAISALNLTFEFQCSGKAPKAYGSLAWHSTLPPEPLPATVPYPSRVLAEINRRSVTYGTTVQVRGQLYADSAVRTLRIYQSIANGPQELVDTFEPRADGSFTRSLEVRGKTTFTVFYDGPGNVSDASRKDYVQVRALIETKVAKASGKQGKYHVIGKGRRTYFIARVLPKSPNQCLRFQAQFFVRGYWDYDAVVPCAKLSKRSVTGVYFDWDRDLVGVPIRIRAEWKGNGLVQSERTGWTFLKMANGKVTASRTAPGRLPRALSVV